MAIVKKRKFLQPRDQQRRDLGASMERFREVFDAGCQEIVTLIQTEEFLRMDMTPYRQRITKCLTEIRSICDRTIAELER